ncbi:MAG: glutamine--fructose-6-phosphate transaminase (isomerizing), partial [Pseudomonadota bacterium]
LAPFANHIAYLEDGDWALVRRGGFEARRIGGGPVTRPVRIVDAASAHVDKGEHRHFMAKEIHEQPDVMAHALAAYVDPGAGTLRPAPLDFTAMTKLTIAACGTALYAGLVAKHWFEGLAALPVEVEAASELRYRNPLFPKGGGAIAISQSGETADTLQALRLAAEAEQSTLALVNVAQSSIARAADAVAEIHAGPEIGVASTKAFTCQLTALAALAGAAAKARGHLAADEEAAFVRALLETPRLMAEALAGSDRIEALAHSIAPARDVLYIGRGLSHPLALEGALKLKEISYIHAEGYAAGELKHGPIALIDTDAPVVVIAPSDALFAKTISNAQEAAARGARIILIGDEAGARLAKENGWEAIEAPKSHPLLSPLVFAAPIQLLAYFVAVAKGTDVDQPRNLAKSVTVE